MSPGMRGIVGVILGCLLALAITYLVEMVNARIYPTPEVDFADPAAVKAMMSDMPRTALVVVLAGWFAGALAGAWLAARFSHPAGWPPLTVGVLLLAAAIMSMYMIPHPIWFWIIGVAIYPVATWLGAKAGGVPVYRA